MIHPIVAVFDRTFGEGKYLPERFDSTKVRHFLTAVSGQEADLHHRWQVVDPSNPWRRGPARGLWQFERGTRVSRGGVYGVFLHPTSALWLRTACEHAGVPFEPRVIWEALPDNDAFACAVARCLLLTDPRPLPNVGEMWPAYTCYDRNWRPGAKRPDDWPANYARASRIIVQGADA